MEGPKLQLDTWEAIRQFVYANKAFPAILDIKASDYYVFANSQFCFTQLCTIMFTLARQL